MNIMVNAFNESSDIVFKSNSINQMNVMEVILRTQGLIESSEDLTWWEARTVATQKSELYQ